MSYQTLEDSTFTVIDSATDTPPMERRLRFTQLEDGQVGIGFGAELSCMTMDQQQLGELGVLLIALAGKYWDHDAVLDLLEGSGMKGYDLDSLSDRLSEIGSVISTSGTGIREQLSGHKNEGKDA